jgi:hypothetical protein
MARKVAAPVFGSAVYCICHKCGARMHPVGSVWGSYQTYTCPQCFTNAAVFADNRVTTSWLADSPADTVPAFEA